MAAFTRHFSFIFFSVFLAMLCCGVPAEAADDAPAPDSAAGVDNVKALNHFNMSLYKIANYNNKAVLDEEYDTINNDLKLDSIADRKIVDIIRQLMDALTSLKISEMERNRMQEAYQQMQEELLMRMLQSGGQAIVSQAGQTLASKNPATKIPVVAAVSLMASTPSIVASVNKPLEDLARQRQMLEDFSWELDKEKLKSLNELNKQFLSTYWEFLHDANIPDSLRISEKQIANLLNVNKDKDPATRYRMLVRLEKECGLIPEYWYYRADAANDALRKKEDQELVADIEQCLAKYKALAGILRRDKTLASLLMLHLSTADLSPEQAREEISSIVGAFPLDASKRLFAALTSMKYGLNEDAMEHLNANLDMRQYEVISRKLLADIYGNLHDEQKELALVEKLLREDSASTQEKLYHLGKLDKPQKFLQELEPEIATINFEAGGMLGDKDIELVMPMRWELLEQTAIPHVFAMGGNKTPADKISVAKDRTVHIKFKNALKKKDIAGKTAVPFEAVIQTRHFPLTLAGTLELPTDNKEDAKGISAKILDKTKKVLNRSAGNFRLQKIQCGDSIFQLEGDKWVRGAAQKS